MIGRASRLSLIAILSLGLAADGLGAQSVSVDRRNRSVTARMIALPVHVGGRVRKVPLARPMPAGAAAYIHQWPGVYFEAAFLGAGAVLKFDDAANEYRLLVDRLKPIRIAQPGKAEIRIGGLRNGPHQLRLEKVTESGNARGAFQGFYIAGTSRPLTVRPRALQMEFIGDSTVTGYADRLPKTDCTEEEVRLTTDTQAAFPALVAKHYGADYQINALSARGVIRNYAGILPEYTLPKLYPYTFLDKTVPYRDGAWRPGIFVIKLNADFVGALTPQEDWATFLDVARDYGKGFGRFIATLHQRSPSAAFVLWWFDTREAGDAQSLQALQRMQRDVVETAGRSGATDVHFMPMIDAGLKRNACHGHYSIEDQQVLARRVTDFIDANVRSWPSARRK